MNAPQTPPTVDYDLAKAPPVIRALVGGVEALTDLEVRAEAVRQWPTQYPLVNWFPEDQTRARNHLKGYVVGIALGVTALEAEPLTGVVKAAVDLDRRINEALPHVQAAQAKRQRKARSRAAQTKALEGRGA